MVEKELLTARKLHNAKYTTLCKIQNGKIQICTHVHTLQSNMNT